jgi:hypothetical protein
VFRRTAVDGSATTADAPCTRPDDEEGAGEEEGRCCYMKSDMRPRLRADLAHFPDAAFFSSPSASAAAATSGRMKQPAAEGFRDNLAKVWVGQAGACTSLHFDLCHGLIAQVFGSKRVTMYPPSESAALSPFRAGEGAVRCAQACQLSMDAGCAMHSAAHPRAASARGVRVVVAAGEALYVPPFWWHHVEALDDNASVLLPFDLSAAEQRACARPWCAPEWGRAVSEAAERPA